MKLWELAKVKIGDTGSVSHVTITAYEKGDYLLMRDKVTSERIKRWVGSWVKGDVVRFEQPQYCLMNFVMYDTVADNKAGNEMRKTMSSHLLNMDI